MSGEAPRDFEALRIIYGTGPRRARRPRRGQPAPALRRPTPAEIDAEIARRDPTARRRVERARRRPSEEERLLGLIFLFAGMLLGYWVGGSHH